MLLVLDNFEQVLEAGPLVAELLAACPQLKGLVTSRAVLHLSAEHAFPVPSMSLPDPKHLSGLEQLSQYEAVRLFIERARAAKPDFEVTNENAPAVAEVCHRLDGLPLAIELAASRVRLLLPQAMLPRITHRLKLLTGGAHDLPERHRTIRATIEWSYELLGEQERRLFRWLAVFAGGCTLDAAEAVCGVEAGDEVLETLSSLVDKSLLRQEEGIGGEPRFLMLETLREYALERLEESGEAEETRKRHVEYYLALAENAEPELRGPRQSEWLERLEEEHNNLRATLRWALDRGEVQTVVRLGWALGIFWWIHVHQREGRRWMEEALATREALPGHMRARALVVAGCMAFGQGHYEWSASRGEESLELFRSAGDKRGEGLALGLLGLVALHQRDYERATGSFKESLGVFRDLGDQWGTALLLGGLGLVSLYRGDYEQATALFEEGLALARNIGDRPSTYGALYNLALVSQVFCDHERAARLFREALELSLEVGDRANIA
ncbi:MAG: tetratricopeptide repeat protein, partial [Chloroflexota bacterium]|nr:tetratricopeptide repeat protein [Chloroflexota bacterium]